MGSKATISTSEQLKSEEKEGATGGNLDLGNTSSLIDVSHGEIVTVAVVAKALILCIVYCVTYNLITVRLHILTIFFTHTNHKMGEEEFYSYNQHYTLYLYFIFFYVVE